MLEQYKKKKKVLSRTISVPDNIIQFFNWMNTNKYNRSLLIAKTLPKTDLYKQFLKEIQKSKK